LRATLKVGRVQAAQLLVEVHQASRQARQATVAAVGLGGHLHGPGQGVLEGHETGRGGAAFGQGVELLFRLFDLVAGGDVGIGALGLDHDLAADADQIAAQGEVVDGAAVVLGVGGRRRALEQVGQVADAAQLLEGGVLLELLGQQDRLGQLALADVGLDGAEQPLVERLVEVAALEQVAQPFIGGVVVHQDAQQRLLGLDVRGGGGDVGIVVDGSQVEGGDDSHLPRLTRALTADLDRVVAVAIQL
jgi:hypothetical protein